MDLHELRQRAKMYKSACRYEDALSLILSLFEKKDSSLDADDLRLLGSLLKHTVRHLKRSLQAFLTTPHYYVRLEVAGEVGCNLLGKLIEVCNRTLSACDAKAAQFEGEAQVMLYKLIGDCWRHKAAHVWNEENSEAATYGLHAYTRAWELSKQLPYGSRARRASALNFAVFSYEVLRDYNSAVTLCKEAMGGRDHITTSARDNMAAWSSCRC